MFKFWRKYSKIKKFVIGNLKVDIDYNSKIELIPHSNLSILVVSFRKRFFEISREKSPQVFKVDDTKRFTKSRHFSDWKTGATQKGDFFFVLLSLTKGS